MRIRDFVAGDEKHLYAVFYSAVHQLAKEHYTAQQLGAWAPLAMDPDLWAQRMQGIRPFVVEDAGEILAYADVQPSGYIDHFFVSGRYARQGIGSMLMLHIHELATQRRIKVLTSDVSRTAQPFFRKFGFVVVAQRKPFVRGVVVLNAFMRKALITAPNQKPF